MTTFEKDVLEGLSRPVKRLSSKYFYDDTGDKIFQEIMRMDAYYLPKAELSILQQRANEIIRALPTGPLDILELGAGDGSKTVHFLRALHKAGVPVTYYPFDISPDVLATNQRLVEKELPGLPVRPVAGDYFVTLGAFAHQTPKVILFLGSNIGNYENREAVNFLKTVKNNMQSGDFLLIGIDLKKNPAVILKAYNDPEGITRKFNLNLLHRINRELNADFQVDQFDHYPCYNPLSGICYSFLVSLTDQVVRIGEHTFIFKAGEVIHTEVSQKYSLAEIEALGNEAGITLKASFTDPKEYFSLNLFQ